MFTGLVETLGAVLTVQDVAAGRRISVRAADIIRGGLAQGDSVSVNGACQTVAAPPSGDVFEVVAVGETLRRTNLGDLRPGARANLERPLRVGDRLGGHLVNGHVDATGALLEVREDGRDRSFRIALPESVERYVVEKGSIAVDGVSLTVGEVEPGSFRVYVIPETWERTLFGTYRTGDRVNLEVDILAKYVERALGFASRDAAAHRGGWASDSVRRVFEAWGEEANGGRG